MTLIQTAKLNGVNPMAYLADVLERVVSGRTKRNEMHTLLPWNRTASTSATITSQAAQPPDQQRRQSSTQIRPRRRRSAYRQSR